MGNNEKISFNSTIDYLDNQWKVLQNIKLNIDNNLSKINLKGQKVSGFKYLRTIDYSDLNSWDVSSKNKNLRALADKLVRMIEKGRSNDIKNMLVKICSGRIKKFSRPMTNKSEYLGHGSFRWNYTVYTLTDDEINHVKQFFNL